MRAREKQLRGKRATHVVSVEEQFFRRTFVSLTLRSLRDMADFSRSLLLVCLYIFLIQHLCPEMHLVPNLCTLYKTGLVVIFMTLCLTELFVLVRI